jgi:(1->4)-alpha-D-glucan 1-alpha-D-glucosylmutase
LTGRSQIPSATYRLQLHKGFSLADAKARLPYFRRLGISHLYLSPILTARAGSMHGYDVVDHSRINPELGGEPALLSLADACHTAGLGLIVDIVPNHMAVGGADNRLWLDVLERGRASAFASTFDIDFDPPDPALKGKVLAPVLGDSYGQAVASGQVELIWDEALGKLAFAYGPHRFPLRPDDYAAVTGAAPPRSADLASWKDPARLHDLLERQNFRLAWWRTAGDAINWRRFFDVNELAGLRIEDPAVFEPVHAVTFRLYAEGVIDGVRVDHLDGLADPAAYARKLRARLTALTAERPAGAPRDGPYLLVEKILSHGETLARDWGLDGTTGYDFMDEVSALQHDPAGAPTLDGLWTRISGRPADFEVEEILARPEILQSAFAAQLMACARAFESLAREGPMTRDLDAETFRRALVGLISRLRVYRSYATGAGELVAPAIAEALDLARAAAPADQPALDFIEAALTMAGDDATGARATAVRHLNQLNAPVTAKSVEDTAFYRSCRLLSRNDVGFDPRRLALDPSRFVAFGGARARDWPRAMLTTATHDHKRGEDVRARLAVLSERADDWSAAVADWLRVTDGARPAAIALDDAYALFQTLLGAWPVDLRADDRSGLEAFGDRVAGWRVKSLREAKLRSSWAAPDEAYEAANLAWLKDLLDPTRSPAFLDSLTAFIACIAPAGAINGVTQAVLRCTWPGIPDLYQGAELWDLSLVDPDNRRPVDYAQRDALVDNGGDDWLGGGVKQALIARILAWRRAEPTLFTHGDLAPLSVRGERANHVLAFERVRDERRATVAVMLRISGAVTRLGQLPSADWWGDTAILMEGDWRAAARLFADEPAFIDLSPSGPSEDQTTNAPHDGDLRSNQATDGAHGR